MTTSALPDLAILLPRDRPGSGSLMPRPVPRHAGPSRKGARSRDGQREAEHTDPAHLQASGVCPGGSMATSRRLLQSANIAKQSSGQRAPG